MLHRGARNSQSEAAAVFTNGIVLDNYKKMEKKEFITFIESYTSHTIHDHLRALELKQKGNSQSRKPF